MHFAYRWVIMPFQAFIDFNKFKYIVFIHNIKQRYGVLMPLRHSLIRYRYLGQPTSCIPTVSLNALPGIHFHNILAQLISCSLRSLGSLTLGLNALPGID